MDEPAANPPAPPPAPPPPRTIGEKLRAGRERSGLSVAAAAEKLHLDPKVIEALEADRFAELGASVYVRGHLRRYGDFVGEGGAELVNAYAAREARAPAPPPDLTQVPHAARRADPTRLVSPLAGLGAAVVLALAIWWVLAGSQGGKPTNEPATPDASREPVPVPDAAVLAAATPAPAAQAVPVAVTPAAAAPANAVATPAEPRPEPPARPLRVTLELTNDSWVEIYDARGERLYYDVASAGSVQSVEGRPPLRVVLGAAAGVSVQVDGQSRPIPESAADGEGARFIVNRAGSLSRAR